MQTPFLCEIRKSRYQKAGKSSDMTGAKPNPPRILCVRGRTSFLMSAAAGFKRNFHAYVSCFACFPGIPFTTKTLDTILIRLIINNRKTNLKFFRVEKLKQLFPDNSCNKTHNLIVSFFYFWLLRRAFSKQWFGDIVYFLHILLNSHMKP